MNTFHHFRYLSILSVLFITVCITGCGEPDIVVTDSATEPGDISGDSSSQTVSTSSTQSETGVGGWWGIRQVKSVFRDDSDMEVDPNNDESLPFAATASDEPTDPDQVWMSEDKVVTDEEYETAKNLVAQQQFAQAQATLQDIIRRHPDSSTAWRWLGDCYYNLLELPQAIEAYQKALSLYPENYFAMRGEGFAHLHYGNELWRQGERRKAHDQYRKALKTLQECMRIYPGDAEALYGRSMAAEGASRRLYQNAITLLRANKNEEAESEAGICIEVIDEGIESARQRLMKNPNEIGPIIITGGLFQRRAILLKNFKRYSMAADNMTKAIEAYEAVLKLSPGNNLAKGELEKCQKYQEELNTLAESEDNSSLL